MSAEAQEGDPQRGFATATVLGLLAVVGLLSAAALHDALFGEQLAGSRLLHLRAQALADFGTADGLARLAAMPSPGALGYALRPVPASSESVEVRLRHVGMRSMPAGFSSGRFAMHVFEIESTGFASRGIRMKQVQGAVRVMPDTSASRRTLHIDSVTPETQHQVPPPPP